MTKIYLVPFVFDCENNQTIIKCSIALNNQSEKVYVGEKAVEGFIKEKFGADLIQGKQALVAQVSAAKVVEAYKSIFDLSSDLEKFTKPP